MNYISSLTLGDIAGWVVGIAAFLSLFVEIVPIKINPITSILSWIGRRINNDLSKKVDDIQDKVCNLETKVQGINESRLEEKAVQSRIRILRFGDELRRGINHSKESFDQTLFDIDVYDNYCKEHEEFKNSITVLTEKKIRDSYTHCIDNNCFLCE